MPYWPGCTTNSKWMSWYREMVRRWREDQINSALAETADEVITLHRDGTKTTRKRS